LEGGRHRQGRAGHGQARAAAEELAQQQHRARVAEAEQHGQQPVDQRPLDDPVQVVEPVAQDGGADHQGQDRRVDPGRPDVEGRGPGRHAAHAAQDRQAGQAAREVERAGQGGEGQRARDLRVGRVRGRVPNAEARTNTTGAAAATRAHRRQRGDGSDPVGVSSSTKPIRAGQTTKVLESYTAA
jgi:hypothetical protein